MARVISDAQVDMTQPNFYAFAAGQYKVNYVHDITVGGIVYKDVLEILSSVNGVLYDYLFAGPSIQVSATGTDPTIVGGTVTGLLTLAWDGAAYAPARSSTGSIFPRSRPTRHSRLPPTPTT